MRFEVLVTALVVPLVGAGCGDNHTARPDASVDVDASVDPSVDAAPDAFVDPILRVSLKLEDLRGAAPPDVTSTYGVVSAANPYDAGGTSWRFQKPSPGHPNEKFELYLPLAEVSGTTLPPALAAVLAHLGPVTIADIASIKVHTRHSSATTNEFAMVAYTKHDGTDDDGTWYGRRLHALLEWADGLSSPADTWNAFSTAAGTNQIRFWDFRNANINAGIQPSAADYFTLADLQAGEITPTGVAEGRDYRTEQLQYVTFMTFSEVTTFDGAIDGIEIVLTSGKGVAIDLGGDPDVLHAKVSLAQMRANHAVGNSYGAASTASTSSPFAGATSWNYVKNGSSPASEKLELHLPFAAVSGATVEPLWDGIRAHLGTFTLADIASIKVHSRRPASEPMDFALLVYTLPDGADDDASWFGRRLHAAFAWADGLAAPADTWNAFSTDAGANQLRFWDFRHASTVAGEQPSGSNYFTLAELQAGEITPAGVTGERDYRTETVQYVTLSTFSDYATFDGSLDGVEIELTNGKQLLLDLEQ